MAGGGAPAPKADEPAPHLPKDQLPNVAYCITSPPPWPEAILLGFQHYHVMLGTTVIIPTALVPRMGGGNEEKAKVIQTLLFIAGLNTLLQTWFGTRLPAVIGGSCTFVAPTISIILSGRWSDPITRFKRIMRATQGAYIVASTIQIVLASVDFGVTLQDFRVQSLLFLWFLFSVLGSMSLVFLRLPNVLKLGCHSSFYLFFLSGKHIFDRFAVLFTVVIVWIYAHLLTGVVHTEATKEP